MTTDPTPDLNQVIVSAVNARVEAEVAKALSGDEVIGRLVTAALQQSVQSGSSFDRKNKPFLTTVLEKAIQSATETAVRSFIAEEIASIDEAVRAALRRDIDRIATGLSESLLSAAAKTYGVDVKVDLKMPRSD